MKKLKRKFSKPKDKGKEASPSLVINLVEATHQIFDEVGSQKAAQNCIRRRTSDGELYAHKRISSSSLSLNLERPKTVYEISRDETSALPTTAGSYRRLESRENDERPVASLEDLRKASEGQKKENPKSSASRSASLDRRTVSIYVQGILRQESLEGENGGVKFQNDTSDEDLDKTPTDVTPVGSSTSDLTPTGSTEDMSLRRRAKKRFSRKWWKEKAHCITEGESMLILNQFSPCVQECSAPSSISFFWGQAYGASLKMAQEGLL